MDTTEALLEQKYCILGSMTLLTHKHIFKTCGGPKSFTSTTISKCGGNTCSGGGGVGWQERYIMKIRKELPYQQ